MLIIILFFTLIMILGILVIDRYNKCVFYRDRILDKYSVIDELLSDRVNIINDLIAVIKDNDLHEDKVIRLLTRLKNSINREKEVNERLVLINDDTIDNALKIKSVHKKVNKLLEDIEERYNKNIDKINYAIDIYNGEVFKYNNYREKKFNKLIFEKFKFYSYNYYEK